ncbi:nicotinamide-nucleotide amidohydrolase family protein [Hyphomicrobium sp. CS1GBMeth3]|uniref:CinA family protein n=1 Tax=Hyphomicrobium sp. CS1GBMeth3 TaxID=1892845 RepID=UPI0009300438|nr:nicotinamide-nucleotide amidohydrolase family protein [Hyphomicrobium sp. CS1GBMeth3]
MFSAELISHAERLLAQLRARGLKLATAESCTGGLLAALFTEIPGASDVYERGFVTYSNAAKVGVLNVDFELLLRHGAVSPEVAGAMTTGARRASAAEVTLAVTGIAGPDGGTEAKPVGLVYVGLAAPGADTLVREFHFGDIGRSKVRSHTVAEALKMLDQALAA